MTDVTIARLPAEPLYALEIWGNAKAVAARFAKAMGLDLPSMGQASSQGLVTLMRFEPTVWLVEGDVSGIESTLADDGALTAIGGGVVRVEFSGPGWRRLLMEGGVFDAENPGFGRAVARQQ